jgi:hypothetical protein
MTRTDKALLTAFIASIVLHAAALFGTPRLNLGMALNEIRPAPLEAWIVEEERIVQEPRIVEEARMVEAKSAKKAAPPKKSSIRKPGESQATARAPASTEPSNLLNTLPPDDSPIVAAGDDAGISADAANVVPPAEPPHAEPRAMAHYPLREARLVFDLYYGRHEPTKVGQVTHAWRHDGDRYHADSVAEAVGFISFFYGGKLIQRSTGQLDATGLVPAEYTLYRGNAGKVETARFDWTERKLVLSWKNESRVVDLPQGAQDPLSLLHQLYFMQPPQSSGRLDVVSSRKLRQYAYELVGEENLILAFGLSRTLHYRRPQSDDAAMDVWLDVDRGLLPTRIVAVDRKGHVLDMQLRELHAAAHERGTK